VLYGGLVPHPKVRKVRKYINGFSENIISKVFAKED